ncbi:MAG: OmpH family outer membrane protein [Acidobacteria bacterium]|nr:OmpH family outer membrane protein [Acidobacteriota bacterium]
MKTMMMRVALGTLMSVALFGQAKIAILNTQKALLDTAEIKKAQADLEAKFKPRTDELKKLDGELVDIQNRLNAGAGKLTPQVEGDLQAQGQRKQREMQRKQEDLQAEVERDRQEILLKASQRMQDVVKKLADEKSYDVVIDTSNAVHFKATLEITADATAAYDKAHPAK